MKPIKTFLFISVGLLAVLAAAYKMHTTDTQNNTPGALKTTSYGAFLAAQHALYTNNFDKADEFLENINDNAKEYKSVDEILVLTNFLNGTVPTDIKALSQQTGIVPRIIVDANLVQNNKWADIYNKHKNDSTRLLAPFRIWSGIAVNHITETLNFISKMPTNPSWQAFLRGQIYAERGKIDKATEAFEKVKPEFMNINDYLYIMSFYKHNNLENQANALRTKFTTKPGSMFMISYTDVPDWSLFSGYKNQLAFNLIQTVAHSPYITHSDLSLLLLHFAENVADKNPIQSDAINYHAGLYMLGNNGNYAKYFAKVDTTSPYYPFVNLRLAEAKKDMAAVRRAIEAQPLFIPAINLEVGWETQANNKRGALGTINKILQNPDISTGAKAYLYKMRAEVNFIFKDIDAAQKDLDSAMILLQKPDPDVFSIQARIWAERGENLNEAYAYSLQLVQFAPGDSCSWDTLGYVIYAREGLDAALDVMHRVGEVANSCSALFEHLGDMYNQAKKPKLARDAYLRAIELSDDGLSIKPVLEKKLKGIK